jgi:hypothetical protein
MHCESIRTPLLTFGVVLGLTFGSAGCTEHSPTSSGTEDKTPISKQVIAFDIINDYSDYTVLHGQTYATPDRTAPLIPITEVSIEHLQTGVIKHFDFTHDPIKPGATESMCCFPEGFYDITVVANNGYQLEFTNFPATLPMNPQTGKPRQSLEVKAISVGGWNIPETDSSTAVE